METKKSPSATLVREDAEMVHPMRKEKVGSGLSETCSVPISSKTTTGFSSSNINPFEHLLNLPNPPLSKASEDTHSLNAFQAYSSTFKGPSLTTVNLGDSFLDPKSHQMT